MVNYTCENGAVATEKFIFECYKNISAAMTNPYQWNPCMTSEITFVIIPFYYLLYQEFLTLCAYQ